MNAAARQRHFYLYESDVQVECKLRPSNFERLSPIARVGLGVLTRIRANHYRNQVVMSCRKILQAIVLCGYWFFQLFEITKKITSGT
jgi:hypothetical protein